MVANLIALACVVIASAPTGPRSTDLALERVRGWAARVFEGAHTLQFNDDGWLGFGPVSFEFLPVDGSVEVCVWIADTQIDGRTPAETARIAAVARALNDPSIGGMYERAGASFRWDRSVEAILLCKRLNASAQPSVFNAEVDELLDVALEWRLDWFFEVTTIVHDGQPRPATRKTRSLLEDTDAD